MEGCRTYMKGIMLEIRHSIESSLASGYNVNTDRSTIKLTEWSISLSDCTEGG